ASVRFLMAFGDLMIGWRLLHQAEVALSALDGEAADKDRAFYEGKVAVAQFFARNVLPELTATRKIVENIDNEIMELDEAAF
ncbi:MAG: acyl-CoA dehydrogenase C-terminal domain-containing protein, partial [Tomitella sp.]|nr:acyl-CoA dehydrogenase C-terminal domain-containing protein [Tomitella sp.]